MPNPAISQPGVHYATIERKIPAWLKLAPPETHRAMRNRQLAPAWLPAAIQQQPDVAKAWQEEHARHREHQAQVHKLFERLPDLETYASETLTKAIKQRFGLDLDVRNTYLVDARLIDSRNAIDSRQAIDRATRSLLHCALHNFDQAAAAEHGMDAPDALLKKSVILDHRRFMGTVPITNTVDITAEAFADLCRTLDIGGKYHEQVHAIYYPAGMPRAEADQAALAVYETLGRAEVSAFRQSLHFARLKGDISETLYAAALAAPLEQAPSTNSTVTFSWLDLWEAELTGVVLLTLQAAERQAVALYIPEDSTRPLKEFASQEALLAELGERLQADIHYLDKHICDRDKASVITRLKDRLTPLGWSTRGIREPVADLHATLHPVTKPFSHAFQGVMAFQKTQRHEKDVLFHAIPTEIVDRRTAQAHLELVAGRVWTSLNIAGFFVPGLGEIMLAVCVAQLATEVYDGIQAWQNDERDTAYTYMLDVIENVAIMTALSAAARALKGANGGDASGVGEPPLVEEPDEELPEVERIPVATPSFIEELEDVETPDGEVRLWKPDLTPYQSTERLPAGLETDELGLVQHDGRQWLALSGENYIVGQAPATGEYYLQHPQDPHRYRPPLRHNGAGAWLHRADNPLSWSGMELLRRIGHLSAHFDDQTLQRLVAVSGIGEDALRRALAESQRLPALLQDTLQRFKLDQTIRLRSTGNTRPSDFAAAYAGLSRQLEPGAEAIQRAYPTLPTAVANELAHAMSASELQMLSGKVPLRLGEEIRIYRQQIRLARAYEGLYLCSGPNWDTDRLIMQTLASLPGWPGETRIQLLQRLSWPPQEHALGPLESPPHTITHAAAGYIVHDESQPNAPIRLYPSLYAAVYAMLPAAMTQLGVADEQALQRLIQDSPLLPRPALRTALGMQPVRPGYRSPMRLADGRLGYPLGGSRPRATSISRQSLLNSIRQVGQHVLIPRPAEQLLTALENRNLNRSQIDDMLRGLLEQRDQLQSRLDDWRQLAALSRNQDVDDVERLLNAVTQYWYDSAFRNSDRTSPLQLERLSLLDFPLQLPEFFSASVTDLRLIETLPENYEGWNQHSPHLNSLFRQFPNLRSLEISRAYRADASPSPFQFSLPVVAQHLPMLESLNLSNQNITLSSTDIDSLVGLTRLRRLDLSGNRLSEEYPPQFNELTLDYLGLDNMALDHWPEGIRTETVSRVGHLGLRHNHIRVLPRFLSDSRVPAAEQALVSLQGNPICEDDIRRIILSEDGRASRFEIDQSEAFRTHLTALLEQRQQLRDSIDNYLNASSSAAPVSQAMLASRTRIATELNAFWHNQEIGLSRAALRLNDVSLEHFPRSLPRFLTDRVHNLVLERVSGSTAQLEGLLGRLPGITRLTIDNYQGAEQTLPTALLRLPGLTDLALRSSGLVIDQNVLDTLGRLPNLNSLDFTDNRMGVITSAPPSLRTLRRLDLNGMALEQWPDWVDSLLPLEMLDLSDNRLTDLPPHILANLDNDFPISSILLFSNPLTEETVARVRASSESQRSFTFAIDVSDSMSDSSGEGAAAGHFHLPYLDPAADEPNVDNWLLASEVENEALRNTWEALEATGSAGNLLALVGRLRNSAPYQNGKTRAALCARVRQVLVRALVNPDDLALFNHQASEALLQENGDQTCHDGALLVFQTIELFIANQSLQIDGADTEANLYRELRRLYRLQALDKIAKSEAASRDEAEVRLTYRRELNTPLDLGQPDDPLRYAINASMDELASAELQVQRGELGEDFLNFAAGNDRWVQYLRQAHADRFAEIEQAYQAQVSELPDQYPDQPVDALEQQFRALERSKQARELRLIRELTSFADPERRPRSSTE
nr:DUF6543 domain-containing protein [Pseudomonas sp. Marseille-Q3773]